MSDAQQSPESHPNDFPSAGPTSVAPSRRDAPTVRPLSKRMSDLPLTYLVLPTGELDVLFAQKVSARKLTSSRANTALSPRRSERLSSRKARHSTRTGPRSLREVRSEEGGSCLSCPVVRGLPPPQFFILSSCRLVLDLEKQASREFARDWEKATVSAFPASLRCCAGSSVSPSA